MSMKGHLLHWRMPASSAIRPPFDRSRHAAPQVFERLREMILSLELVPGLSLIHI